MRKENLSYFEENSPAAYQELKEEAQVAEIEAARAIRRLGGKDQQKIIELETHSIFNKTANLLKKHGSFEDIPATLTMGVGGENHYKYLERPIGDNSVAVETSPARPTKEIVKRGLDEKEVIMLLSIHTQNKVIPEIKFSIKNEGIFIFRFSEDDKGKPTYKKANEIELFELDKIINALVAGAEYDDKHLSVML